MVSEIRSFTDNYRWLSNFWVGKPVMSLGVEFQTAEHLYQALKTNDPDQIEWVRTSPTPGTAKRRGAKVDLRPDWDLMRVDAMMYTLGRKFMGEQVLQDWLLSTGDAELVEGNTWHDNYFGVCSCDGCRDNPEVWPKNVLGKLLMNLRKDLRLWTYPSNLLLEGAP